MKHLQFFLPIFLITAIPLLFYILFNSANSPDVKGSESVNITAQIPATINLVATPEKRLPQTNNLNADFTLRVRNSTHSLDFTDSLDSNGEARFENVQLNSGIFNVGLKGDQHLTETEFNTQLGDPAEKTLEINTPLRAGDVAFQDDKINLFDYYSILNQFYTSDDLNDLNKDGVINGLDASMLLFNYNETGDEILEN